MEFGNAHLEVPKDYELQYIHNLFHEDRSPPKKNHQDLCSRNEPENHMLD